MPARLPVFDIKHYRNAVFLATTVGFFLPLVCRIRDVTTEIESGVKELQKVMGLSSSIFWIGHFVSAWLVSALEAAIATLIVVVLPEKYQPEEKVQTLDIHQQRELDTIYNHVYENVPETSRYLQNPDNSLVVACFATFVTCHTLLALFIACAFPLGQPIFSNPDVASLEMIAGFIVCAGSKRIACAQCIAMLQAPNSSAPNHGFIKHLHRGGLYYPTQELVKVLGGLLRFVNCVLSQRR
ncbi:hypothetical protein MRX96_011979 [Rhipicephalus microplus]